MKRHREVLRTTVERHSAQLSSKAHFCSKDTVHSSYNILLLKKTQFLQHTFFLLKRQCAVLLHTSVEKTQKSLHTSDEKTQCTVLLHSYVEKTVHRFTAHLCWKDSAQFCCTPLLKRQCTVLLHTFVEKTEKSCTLLMKKHSAQFKGTLLLKIHVAQFLQHTSVEKTRCTVLNFSYNTLLLKRHVAQFLQHTSVEKTVHSSTAHFCWKDSAQFYCRLMLNKTHCTVLLHTAVEKTVHSSTAHFCWKDTEKCPSHSWWKDSALSSKAHLCWKDTLHSSTAAHLCWKDTELSPPLSLSLTVSQTQQQWDANKTSPPLKYAPWVVPGWLSFLTSPSPPGVWIHHSRQTARQIDKKERSIIEIER